MGMTGNGKLDYQILLYSGKTLNDLVKIGHKQLNQGKFRKLPSYS